MRVRVPGISEVNSWDCVTINCNRDLRCVISSVSPKQGHQQPTLTSGRDSIAKVSDVAVFYYFVNAVCRITSGPGLQAFYDCFLHRASAGRGRFSLLLVLWTHAACIFLIQHPRLLP